MKVKCLWCGEIISNTEFHNMKWCKCGKTGLDYHDIWPRIACQANGDNDMYEWIE